MSSIVRLILFACAAVLHCIPVWAQSDWPNKPIRFVVPYTPGGATDVVTRLLANKLTGETQWAFVVENRSGGNGNIGMDVVAKAKPDGYTIGMGQTANLAINPTLFSKMSYDALKDFVPVSVAASQPVVMVVRADASYKSLADVVSAAKSQPGAIRQALAGTGTLGHMAGELLAKRAGFQVLNVPYKGASPAVTDLLGGQTDYMFATPQAALAMVKGKKLRALAVTSSKRLPVMPDVATVAESYPQFEAVDWKVVVAPAGTPSHIISQLNAAIEVALAKPETIAQLQAEGSTPVGGSAEQAARYLQAEHARWGALVRETGVHAD